MQACGVYVDEDYTRVERRVARPGEPEDLRARRKRRQRHAQVRGHIKVGGEDDVGVGHEHAAYGEAARRELRREGGRVRRFSSLCGGLPAPECAFSANPFGYKFSWSPAGELHTHTRARARGARARTCTRPRATCL